MGKAASKIISLKDARSRCMSVLCPFLSLPSSLRSLNPSFPQTSFLPYSLPPSLPFFIPSIHSCRCRYRFLVQCKRLGQVTTSNGRVSAWDSTNSVMENRLTSKLSQRVCWMHRYAKHMYSFGWSARCMGMVLARTSSHIVVTHPSLSHLAFCRRMLVLCMHCTARFFRTLRGGWI